MQSKTILILAIIVSACATQTTSEDYANQIVTQTDSPVGSPGLKTPAMPLAPVAQIYSGNNSPIIKHIISGSAAEHFGFKLGDLIVELNGEKISIASQFEKRIRQAPQDSHVKFLRGRNLISLPVVLRPEKPRFGASFEPSHIELINPNSPLIAYIHVNEMTVHAEITYNEKTESLRLNLIIESSKPVPRSILKGALFEKGATKPFAIINEPLDALGASPVVFSKSLHKSLGETTPVNLALQVEKNHFAFAFQ